MAEVDRLHGDVKEIIRKLRATLQNCCQQLLDDLPQRENLEFDLSVFWKNFTDATKLVSLDAAKLYFAFKEEGLFTAEVAQRLVDKVEMSCLSLLVVFLSLPKLKGITLFREIRIYVTELLQGMEKLCAALITDEPSDLVIQVGDIQQLGDAVQGLSRDNKEAVLVICKKQLDMVHDASQELMDDISNEHVDQSFELSLVTPLNGVQIPAIQTWTDSDRNVLLPCSGLLKAFKACIKKTVQAITDRGDASNEGRISELDAVAEIVKPSSSLADDFVYYLCPQMEHTGVHQQASLIKDKSKTLLECVRRSHFCSEGDETWIEFLEKAVDHNWVRICDMVLAD